MPTVGHVPYCIYSLESIGSEQAGFALHCIPISQFCELMLIIKRVTGIVLNGAGKLWLMMQ